MQAKHSFVILQHLSLGCRYGASKIDLIPHLAVGFTSDRSIALVLIFFGQPCGYWLRFLIFCPYGIFTSDRSIALVLIFFGQLCGC